MSNHLQVLIVKGEALEKLGKHEEAIDNYDNALRFYPDSHVVWSSKALVLRNIGKLEESLNCYNKALELSPANPEVLNGMAMTYAALGDFDKSLEIVKGFNSSTEDS